MAVICLALVITALGRIAIVNAERRDGERKRGDALQASVNALRDRSEEDRRFFEIVRELLIAQGQEQKQALLDQLRGFKFATPITSTTTTILAPSVRVTATTTTTSPKTSTTTAPRAPPSTTTTTSTTTTVPKPPPIGTCVTTPLGRICQPQTNTNKRKG